jgi:hypothetical protein
MRELRCGIEDLAFISSPRVGECSCRLGFWTCDRFRDFAFELLCVVSYCHDIQCHVSASFHAFDTCEPLRLIRYAGQARHSRHIPRRLVPVPRYTIIFSTREDKEKTKRRKPKGYWSGSGSGLEIQDLQKVFGDHAGFPRSLCEHAGKGEQKYGKTTGDMITVASVIYDLKKFEMHLCKGNPCCGSWKVYSIGGKA